ncbi:MAG TPA: tRNA 2-thiouridine(34) synthase MnmA [Hypericibacter adhaerens]|jgi:tRNA-specific 2-thiouridylase|uniref:tRNA-specific 2-thiouridylase MnmA n=2 Tax=Hypericibacter adhaerens TaxID=2602016 RepID=A0A5J6MWX2_9PROT|nr:tRNA 2-thiouridine(34) synthase MnmA [Hypericibacter adhaerens]QEX21543.1 tRNA-specific 2-thiouridylase MnmA [Hypericibacter adhaerens]HWA45551.1 tRNA 2-thiouridine(34) synthase MnmA [Hypericibacter adhaerens]
MPNGPALDGLTAPLRLEGVAPGARVVAAMSGGVDSSVAAALLAQAGYEVVGITLQLYDHGAAVGRKGACCAGQDIYDAKRVADRLGIDHYVLDYESRFRSAVIEEFADSYLAGETPIPCVRCNERVKFGDLLGTARELGAAALATGHYVRRLEGSDGPELHRAVDPARDQSYFLFATTGAQLDYLRFPLGGLEKPQTRAIAERLGLGVAAKPDSQDICFVPSGRYAEVVEKLRPGAAEPGDIVHVDGRLLGRHGGLLNYTVGQRRGIGISESQVDGEPLYVVRLEPARRRLVVGPKAALGITAVRLGAVNWLGSIPAGGEGEAVEVKLRSMSAPVPARLWLDGQGGARVDLDQPQLGVAPGQACVFYRGSRVLGGGWIRRNEPQAEAAA